MPMSTPVMEELRGGRGTDMVYVDTGVLVPLFLNAPHSAAVTNWYAREKGELVAAAWCVPAFASALGIRLRAFTSPQATQSSKS